MKRFIPGGVVAPDGGVGVGTNSELCVAICLAMPILTAALSSWLCLWSNETAGDALGVPAGVKGPMVKAHTLAPSSDGEVQGLQLAEPALGLGG